MFVTYILRSEKDGGFYFGHCSDLGKRLQRHNKGKVRSTKSKVRLAVHWKRTSVTGQLSTNSTKEWTYCRFQWWQSDKKMIAVIDNLSFWSEVRLYKTKTVKNLFAPIASPPCENNVKRFAPDPTSAVPFEIHGFVCPGIPRQYYKISIGRQQIKTSLMYWGLDSAKPGQHRHNKYRMRFNLWRRSC